MLRRMRCSVMMSVLLGLFGHRFGRVPSLLLSSWLVGPSRPMAWLVRVVLFVFVQSSLVEHGFVILGVTCLFPLRRMMFFCVVMLLWLLC